MRTKILIIFTLCILSVGVISCNRPVCTNENPVFENNSPRSKIYKDELVKQLETVDASQLTYWLQKYQEEDGQEYLYFYVQGDGLCVILQLSVKDWNKLEEIRKKKGVGRRGAEFTNLKFKINQDDSSTEFEYITYYRLID